MQRYIPRPAGIGVVATFVGFGFGRFAYGALLPSMRDDLGLSYSAAGLLATLNLLAYLVGAQLARALLWRRDPRQLIGVAMFGTSVMLALLGLASGFAVAVVAMVALGFLSSTVWISVIQLMRETVSAARQGRFLGIAGLGAAWGIPVVGALVGTVTATAGDGAWRLSWFVMAAVAFVAAVVARAALRDVPERSSVEPIALDFIPDGVSRWTTRSLLLAYLLYGAWLSIFATFVVSFLQDGGHSAGSSTAVWSMLGLAAGMGTLFFGRLCDRFGSRRVAAGALLFAAVAASLVSVSPSWSRLGITVVVGFPMVGTGTALTVYASQLYDDMGSSTKIVAVATTVNAFGQAIGPSVAGPIIDASGSYTLAFLLAAACAMGAASALAVRAPRP